MTRGLMILAAAGGILVAGCGGSGAAHVLRSPVPTVPSTSAASPSAAGPTPSQPAVATDPPTAAGSSPTPGATTATQAAGSGFPATPEGAAAIAKAFYAGLDTYLQTGDGGAFFSVTSTKCPCRIAQQTLTDFRAAHQKLVVGDTMNVKTSDFSEFGGFGRITTTYDASGDNVLDAHGKTIRHDRGRQNVVDVLNLSPMNGTWVVTNVNSLNPGTL